jgi:hypothetical protein
MENPNLKFGVNCYGVKPQYSNKDISGIKIQSASSISNVEQARIDYWKQHMDQLQINSFNFSNWTEYGLPSDAQPVVPYQVASKTEISNPTYTPAPSNNGNIEPTVVP